MRFMILLSGLLIACGVTQAQTESDAPSELDSPGKTIQRCFSSLRSGDFEAYVNTLTAKELDVQAGYIFYCSSLSDYSSTSLGLKPSEVLSIRIIDAVKERHLVPRERWTKEQKQAATLPSQLMTMAFTQGLSQASFNPYNATSVPFGIQANMRTQCQKMAGLFNDRRAFLVELLTEWFQPLEVTKGGQTVAKDVVPNELDPLLLTYEKANWTIYKRGKFAIAIAKPAPVEIAASQNANKQPPVPNTESPKDLFIELRLVGKEWKINQLVPDLDTVAVNKQPQTATYPSYSTPSSPQYSPYQTR